MTAMKDSSLRPVPSVGAGRAVGGPLLSSGALRTRSQERGTRRHEEHSQPQPRTAVSSMLGRRVADRDEGQWLTTSAVGRDGRGCRRTASQLMSTQNSLGRAWRSSPRVAATQPRRPR